MMSRRVLGAVALVGLAAGVVLAAHGSPSGADASSVARAQALYRTEVALGAQQARLQAALQVARSRHSVPAAAPAHVTAPTAVSATVTGAPAPHGHTAATSTVAVPQTSTPRAPDAATPTPTEGVVPAPEPAPTTTTTTTAPAPTTTTTAPPPTTTTTRPRRDD